MSCSPLTYHTILSLQLVNQVSDFVSRAFVHKLYTKLSNGIKKISFLLCLCIQCNLYTFAEGDRLIRVRLKFLICLVLSFYPSRPIHNKNNNWTGLSSPISRKFNNVYKSKWFNPTSGFKVMLPVAVFKVSKPSHLFILYLRCVLLSNTMQLQLAHASLTQ